MYKIEHMLEKPVLFEQLAEEAVELAHASLKYARAIRGENPVRVSDDEAYAKITEEFTDVIQCARILGIETDEDQIAAKNQRWLDSMIEKVQRESPIKNQTHLELERMWAGEFNE